MFDHDHYVPALKGKAGEFAALRHLFPGDKAGLTPLLDVPPVPWDFSKGSPARSIDDHLRDLPADIQQAWGADRRLFMDLGLVEPTSRMATGAHPVDTVFAAAAANGLQLVPVTAQDRDVAFQLAVRTVVARDGRGVCFRIGFAELFERAEATLAGLSQAVLGRALDAAAAGQVDLVIDLGEIADGHVPMYRVSLPMALGRLPHLMAWRSITLLAGSFPSDLSARARVGLRTDLPRAEWALWRALRSSPPPRMPTFGDYGAQNPELAELDMRIIQPSATIKYTIANDWAVFRGQGLRNHGFQQFRSLSTMIVADMVYSGPAFSHGDQYVHDCANNVGGTGNLTTWVTVATNHHMTFVVRQIASLPGLGGVGGPPPGGLP
jgi:hypothetical protein